MISLQWRGRQDDEALAEFCGHWVSLNEDGPAPYVTTDNRGAVTLEPADYVMKFGEGRFRVVSAGAA